MTATTSRVWLTVGTIAVAVAAALSPTVAQAAPADDTDSSAVGDSAGTPAPRRAPRPVSRGEASAPDSGAPRAAVGDLPAAGATGANPLIQNPLWWFGSPNPNPPTPAYTRTFNPLASLPGWTNSYSGWFRNMDFEACVLGLSNTTTRSVGPYGTTTNSVSTGGC